MAFGWMVACIVLDIGVIIANIFEEILILKRWSNLDRIDHLLFSLSISDLLNGITTLSVDSWYISNHHPSNDGSNLSDEDIVMSKSLTKILDALFLFSVFASIFHIIAVAIERLFAIRFPRHYYIFTTFKVKCATIITVWVLASAFTPTFAVTPAFSFSYKTGSLMRAIALTVCISIVFFVYLYISYLLFYQRKSIISDLHVESGIQDEKLKRLTFLCFFFAFSFVLCVLPITLGYYDDKLYHPISSVFITVNSLINPCVYYIKVYWDSRISQRTRSDTTNALLEEPRNYAYTTTTLAPDFSDAYNS